jgi:flagellar hook-associated protein 1
MPNFSIPLSGLTAESTALSTIANNLANQNTTRFKSKVVLFSELTQQIAELNTQISRLENVGRNAGTFIDQRTQLINQLSSFIDVSVIPSNNTLTLTTADGTPLVAGQQSFQISTQPDSSGIQHIYSQGSDITGAIVSGELGGILQARDQNLPDIQNQLDILGSGFTNAVNHVQTSGYDLNGSLGTGHNLFTVPASVTGAAASLSVAITDPALIAASSDGTSGSNGNAEALYALCNQAGINGQSATDYYSGIVFNVGNLAANSKSQQDASNLVLQQLNDQRSSISGVSLDEEAANMMRYQQVYAASAQIISSINQMMEVVINMKNS